jgi:hypothetical protein
MNEKIIASNEITFLDTDTVRFISHGSRVINPGVLTG